MWQIMCVLLKKELHLSRIDVIFILVEKNIGTRIHSGHGHVARDFSLEK